jgi:hypothetical protein
LLPTLLVLFFRYTYTTAYFSRVSGGGWAGGVYGTLDSGIGLGTVLRFFFFLTLDLEFSISLLSAMVGQEECLVIAVLIAF